MCVYIYIRVYRRATMKYGKIWPMYVHITTHTFISLKSKHQKTANIINIFFHSFFSCEENLLLHFYPSSVYFVLIIILVSFLQCDNNNTNINNVNEAKRFNMTFPHQKVHRPLKAWKGEFYFVPYKHWWGW